MFHTIIVFNIFFDQIALDDTWNVALGSSDKLLLMFLFCNSLVWRMTKCKCFMCVQWIPEA